MCACEEREGGDKYEHLISLLGMHVHFSPSFVDVRL